MKESIFTQVTNSMNDAIYFCVFTWLSKSTNQHAEFCSSKDASSSGQQIIWPLAQNGRFAVYGSHEIY